MLAIMTVNEAAEPTLRVQPAYLTALDKVVAQADIDLPRETPDDTLEERLAQLGQLTAVFRGDDIFSLLVDGESALLAGALGRSLIESAAAEQWFLSRDPVETPRTATLAQERENIAQFVGDSNLNVPNLVRWTNPLPDALYATAKVGPGLPNLQSSLAKKAPATIERTILLPAAILDVLGMCSHVNHAATWLTAAPGAAQLGITALPAFAATLAQSSGHALASIRGFNFHSTVIDLLAASTLTHDFDVLPPLGKVRLVQDLKPSPSAATARKWLEDPTPPFFDSALERLNSKAAVVWNLVNEAPDPFAETGNSTNLTAALPYLTARGLLLQTIKSSQGQGSPLMAPTGARMLFEQGSELAWRAADASDEALKDRYVAVMDDATHRKKSIESQLLTRTSSKHAIEQLLYPLGRSSFAVDTRRTPAGEKPIRIPSPGEHLDLLELGIAEPNWGQLAYKLLTQAAHATPLGLLHAVARTDPATGHFALSHEMSALAIDTACIGAALTFRSLAPVVTYQAGLPSPLPWVKELFEAVRQVHREAQLIHFLG